MPFPLPKVDTRVSIIDPPKFEKSTNMTANESEAIASELDELIKRFNYT